MQARPRDNVEAGKQPTGRATGKAARPFSRQEKCHFAQLPDKRKVQFQGAR
jgi:hypothetical protein